MIPLPCPVCQTLSAEALNLPEVDVYRCAACDHCFSDPGSIETPESYHLEYFRVKHKNWFEHPDLRLFSTIFKILVAHKPQASVIDVGCGLGDCLRYLHEKDPSFSLTGIDLVKNEPADGITFIQGNALDTPGNKSYDVVMTLGTIEHVADVQAFTRVLYDLCAPDGQVIVLTMNDRSLVYQLARWLYQLGYAAPVERLYSTHHLNHFSTRSLRHLLESRGFTVERLIHHNPPLAAIDLPDASLIRRRILLTGVWGSFVLGSLLRRTYLQIVVCRKRSP